MPPFNGSMLLWKNRKTSVVVTGLVRPSKNEKTGNMAQTWVLKSNAPPSHKTKGAGCKGCPVFDACYVRWEQAPRQVYKSLKAGRYKEYDGDDWQDRSLISDIALRVGSAGEPTEMPAREWKKILTYVSRWTGYTHKWKPVENISYRSFCMASVHSVRDMKLANGRGFRTYRVGGAPITKDEIMCPHYTHGVQCVDCGLCMGSTCKAKNIYAPAHGAHKNKIPKEQ